MNIFKDKRIANKEKAIDVISSREFILVKETPNHLIFKWIGKNPYDKEDTFDEISDILGGRFGIAMSGDELDIAIRDIKESVDDTKQITGSEFVKILRDKYNIDDDIASDFEGTKTFKNWVKYLIATYKDLDQDLFDSSYGETRMQNKKNILLPLSKLLKEEYIDELGYNVDLDQPSKELAIIFHNESTDELFAVTGYFKSDVLVCGKALKKLLTTETEETFKEEYQEFLNTLSKYDVQFLQSEDASLTTVKRDNKTYYLNTWEEPIPLKVIKYESWKF